MAVATIISFTWTEVAELLIKKADVHEGRWVAIPEYSVNAGIIGQSPGDSRPGVALLLPSLQLAKADPNSPSQLVVDAAVVNPKT